MTKTGAFFPFPFFCIEPLIASLYAHVMRIQPFAAIRPVPEQAARVAAVPYDVVDTDEARALAAGNPDSFLHVSRPEIDLPPGADPHRDEVYCQGARALQRLLTRGLLLRDAIPRFYVYRQVMGTHQQTGIVVCCHIDDYAEDAIRKHEKTRQDKEDDRTRHTLALKANTGPVFLTYRDREEIDQRVAAVVRDAPLYDFIAPDGVRHVVWPVDQSLQQWIEACEAIPMAYVADGHHRAKAAYRAGCMLRDAHPQAGNEAPWNWFLCVMFPASHLKILPYNRCVADLNGLSTQEFLARVRAVFRVESASATAPEKPCRCHMYLEGAWYRLSWPLPEDGDPVAVLDVSVLQDRLLRPILGIDDPRTDQRISFVGGIRGPDELTRVVGRGDAAVAFSMYPVTVSQMMDIADAGKVMPPKSTWFEPKLRSGLLVHEIA